MSTALECKNITKYYIRKTGVLRNKEDKISVLDNISFKINTGETLGLVGPSGCGKSTLARIITGLIPATSGDVIIGGKKMLTQKDFVGNVQIVFQNPFSSLNPKLKIGYSIQEPLLLKYKREKTSYDSKSLKQEVESTLEKVGIEINSAGKFPHEFSGGQRQRIAIARALIARPTLLVCDEAVSALDVSIQAQILNLLKDLREAENLSMLFISHDMDVINTMSDNILHLNAN